MFTYIKNNWILNGYIIQCRKRLKLAIPKSFIVIIAGWVIATPRAAESGEDNKNRSSPVILKWMVSRRGEKWKVPVMFVFLGEERSRFSALLLPSIFENAFIRSEMFFFIDGGMYFATALYVMRIVIILIIASR